MKYCPNCNQYKDSIDASFCNTCGTKLIDSDLLETEEQVDNTNTCPNCGTNNKRDNKFCSKCGYELTLEAINRDIPTKRKTGKKGIIILIVLILVLLGVLGFIGYKFIEVLFPNILKKQPAASFTEESIVSTEITSGTEENQTNREDTTPDGTNISPTETTTTNNIDLTTTGSAASEDEATTNAEPKPIIKSARTLSGAVLGSSNSDVSRTFDADQSIDGKPETCWCVNTENKGGVGAEIMIALEDTAIVHGIKIINGNTYLPNEDIYKSNGQIRDFSLEFSTGETKAFTASYNDDGSATYQTITFDESVETSYIVLHVDSGYIGEKYTTNVCLGEIDVF